MCRMLLSINPEYVEKIFNGSKIFEFRKVKCKRKVDSILIYETFPVMKVVGEAKIKNVFTGFPKDVWIKTKDGSGISKKFFDSYYENRETAIAYELTNVKKYKTPKPIASFGILSAPQSFVYLDS